MAGYRDWERVQGIPELHALEEARRRQEARDDAARIKAAGGFDADLLYGTPSYGMGNAASQRHDQTEAEESRG